MSENIVITCPHCGAHARTGAEWCPQCFQALAPEPNLEEAPAPTFAPPDRFLGPAMPTEWSRWAKSQTTFGPFGRVMCTLFLVVIPVWLGMGYSPIFSWIWVIAVMPPLLASIWKRVPVRRDPEQG